METIGRHILIELSGCREDFLEDIEKVREILVAAAEAANAEIMKVAMHKFSPQGVSGVVVIAESHLSIHTWPEYKYAAADIYTCGDKTVPEKACRHIAIMLEAEHVYQSEIIRGIAGPRDHHRHSVKTSEYVPGEKVAS